MYKHCGLQDSNNRWLIWTVLTIGRAIMKEKLWMFVCHNQERNGIPQVFSNKQWKSQREQHMIFLWECVQLVINTNQYLFLFSRWRGCLVCLLYLLLILFKIHCLIRCNPPWSPITTRITWGGAVWGGAMGHQAMGRAVQGREYCQWTSTKK